MTKGNEAAKPDQNSDQMMQAIDWSAQLAEHSRWLRTVIAARCQETQAVDEIFQELSLAVVKQSAPLRDPSKVAPWLYNIAVRQSLMYRRKHGRRRNMEQRYADRMEATPQHQQEPNPLDWLLTQERQELIREGVSRLSPKDAEILMLKYTEDWTYQEIAEHLDTSASAVESRLHRARKKLRTIMSSLEVIEARQ